ncbi:hypothetical protein PISL3812_08309 [Talaromyces islandicus]|uniref:Azaphilone pigments biosynthesis cluster protein L N-terminal domain-containing protein n=1 Tax=Talaromyces islandicus TaxID=28573 RepID=A0A0U1M875_TALIS|nr:hypothetical protein PISL3812_08309 [Talaromyces islandicus]
MAEPIGVASGLLTLAAFAFQSSVTLCETIKSFTSHPKRVRDLLEEIQALIEVLGPLNDRINATTEAGLSALNLPLKRCGDACKDFEKQILKCVSRSGDNRTSFRDWARLRYMSDDIDGFRRLLAGYKLTINVALTDASLRQSSATSESLESHKFLIETARDDLEAHLESIDDKLEQIMERAATESRSDSSELSLMKEERLSTEKCLQICASLSEHIDQLQVKSKRGDYASSLPGSKASPENITNEGLQECKENLVRTAAKLETYMQELMIQMLTKTEANMNSGEDLVDLKRLREEWETTRQCMEICSRADQLLKENVTTIDNYGTGDAVQFMVSTSGQVIHGKNRGLGWRTRQVGGHISDDSVQQLSRDMTSINLRSAGNKETAHGDPISDSVADQTSSEYSQRFGRGFVLTPKTSLDESRAGTSLSTPAAHYSPKN